MKKILVGVVVVGLGVAGAFLFKQKWKAPKVEPPKAARFAPPPPTPVPTLSERDADVALVRWKAIWNSPKRLERLRKYRWDYGLFLETTKEAGSLSYLAADDACGKVYISLVPDAGHLPKPVYEIGSDGRVLAMWNSGSGKVLRFEGDRLFREAVFFEDPRNNAIESRSKGRKHSFVVAISSKGFLDVFEKKGGSTKAPFYEIPCPNLPEGVATSSSYCVQDPTSGRRYVFQRPCDPDADRN